MSSTEAVPVEPSRPADTGGHVDHVELRRGVYHDSVTLLRMSQAVGEVPGVLDAQIAMSTPFNLEFAVAARFGIPEGAGANDLLVALRAVDETALSRGLDALAAVLEAADRASHAPARAGAGAPPRTVRAAAAAAPDAAVVLISVPGPWVLGEAMDAIAAGRHPMIFSDNVPIEHEIALKRAAAQAGVLVMGPDCGTAVLGGVGLGFANVLAPSRGGPAVGVVAASGTGAQQLMCLLDDAGVAVSAVLGLGGRDLSAAVGGLSARTALEMLDADPATDSIVLISKPADPDTAERVLRAARAARTPLHTILLGTGGDITSEVETLLASLAVPVPVWKRWLPPAGSPDAPAGDADSLGAAPTGVLHGLFAGGTLADEAMLLLREDLGDIRSNIPLRPDLGLPEPAGGHGGHGGHGAPGVAGLPDLTGLGSVVIDLGDDRFTSGRAHPMIDPTVRLQLLAVSAADPGVSVLLMDVVLGHGAEADPAARLAPAVRAALATRAPADGGPRPLHVVISLCGTGQDPQDRERQARALADAGALVFASNAMAARAAARFARRKD